MPACSCYTDETARQGRRETIKLLLHTCCAPCSVMSVQALRAEGLEPTAYWYNPNIHPLTEYRARRDALRGYAKSIGLELIENDTYGLRPFVRAVAEDIDGRCAYCYDVRMTAAARCAAEHGFTHISTTLFYSPYQNHELLKQTAERAAKEHGVQLYYRDFRPLFREGQRQARALELYMQKYCGCVFSEEERYMKK
jgi:epoxyqueuosine reductase